MNVRPMVIGGVAAIPNGSKIDFGRLPSRIKKICSCGLRPGWLGESRPSSSTGGPCLRTRRQDRLVLEIAAAEPTFREAEQRLGVVRRERRQYENSASVAFRPTAGKCSVNTLKWTRLPKGWRLNQPSDGGWHEAKRESMVSGARRVAIVNVLQLWRCWLGCGWKVALMPIECSRLPPSCSPLSQATTFNPSPRGLWPNLRTGQSSFNRIL